jgi:hypothetical protein
MIAAARRNPPEQQPIGWYHSHTRSEIFLSSADQEIHHRFFPEPWQVALVLKPHTFEPTRAGFFFREQNGSIHSEASYQEFRLEAMPLRATAAPNGKSPAVRRPHPEEGADRTSLVEMPELPAPPKGKGRVPITREIAIDAPPLSANGSHAAEAVAARDDAPKFALRPERSWRVFKAMAILACGIAVGGAGYQTRQDWLPTVTTKLRAVLPHEPAPYLTLAVLDDNGQLKIQWDRNSPAVRNALDATLEITDGNSVPQSVRLDSAHLASGGFTYERQNARVDVTLIASEPDGQLVKEQTSFLGQLPAQKTAPTEDPQASAQDREADTERAEKLQKDLNFQAAKTRKLEKDLKAMQEQLEKSKQSPDAGKKN